MSLLGADMNLMKMRIFTGHRTMGIGKFEEWISEAADGKLHGAKMILGKVQKVCRIMWSSATEPGTDRYRPLQCGTT
jgi:chitinase